MYCPKPECPDTQANGFQAEYRNEVTVCPFCGSGLVATPEPVDAPERPQPKGADDEVFEVVFETGDATEAAIIKSLLEGAEAGVDYLPLDGHPLAGALDHLDIRPVQREKRVGDVP